MKVMYISSNNEIMNDWCFTFSKHTNIKILLILCTVPDEVGNYFYDFSDDIYCLFCCLWMTPSQQKSTYKYLKEPRGSLVPQNRPTESPGFHVSFRRSLRSKHAFSLSPRPSLYYLPQDHQNKSDYTLYPSWYKVTIRFHVLVYFSHFTCHKIHVFLFWSHPPLISHFWIPFPVASGTYCTLSLIFSI